MEIHNESVPEFKSQEIELYIPHSIETEEKQEANIMRVASATRRNIPETGEAQGIADNRRSLDGRPHPHLHQHTAEVRGVECSGLYQGQKCDNDSKTFRRESEISTG